MNLSNIAILNIKGFDYCYIICLINTSEAINLMQNAALAKKKQNIIKHKNLEILTFGDIETERNKLYCNKTPTFLKDVEDVYWLQ